MRLLFKDHALASMVVLSRRIDIQHGGLLVREVEIIGAFVGDLDFGGRQLFGYNSSRVPLSCRHSIIELARLVADRLHHHGLIRAAHWHTAYLLLLIHVSLGAVRALRIAQLVRAMLVMRLASLLPAFNATSLQSMIPLMIRREEALGSLVLACDESEARIRLVIDILLVDHAEVATVSVQGPTSVRAVERGPLELHRHLHPL